MASRGVPDLTSSSCCAHPGGPERRRCGGWAEGAPARAPTRAAAPQVAERCRAAGAASCAALRCDVADGASVDALAAEVEQRAPGGLDALVIVSGVAAEKQDVLTGGWVGGWVGGRASGRVGKWMERSLAPGRSSPAAEALPGARHVPHPPCCTPSSAPHARLLCAPLPPTGDPDEWDRMLAINTLAPMRLTRAFAPAMAARCAGAVVAVGSLAGTVPMGSSAPYAASKWGVRGWMLAAYEVRGWVSHPVVGMAGSAAPSGAAAAAIVACGRGQAAPRLTSQHPPSPLRQELRQHGIKTMVGPAAAACAPAASAAACAAAAALSLLAG